jgi:DNA-binding MarR family transcriptional regulator
MKSKARKRLQMPVQKATRSEPKGSMPLTISRPELLTNGDDRDFRLLVHLFFAFMARHETIRDGHARRIGLAGIEYTTLITIGHLGRQGEVNIKKVADHLRISGAFITTVTNNLQRMNLIEKLATSVDRRRVSLTITDKGRALLHRLAPYQREVNDVEFGSLTREQFRLLLNILDDLIQGADKAVALQAYKLTISESSSA